MSECALADDVIPGPRAVLKTKRRRDRPQLSIVRDLLGRSLKHHIQRTFHQVAAPGGQDARGISAKVLRLALLRSRREPDGIVLCSATDHGMGSASGWLKPWISAVTLTCDGSIQLFPTHERSDK